MSCITNFVGITNDTTLPFWDQLDADLKAKVAVSTSGLYAAALPGGIDLRTVDDLEYMVDALQKGIEAVAEAEKVLSDDLLEAINNRYQSAKVKFHGEIGRRSVSATFPSSPEYQGQRYRMYEPIAGNIRISGISVNVNGDASFNVYVARCEARDRSIIEVLATLPVNSVANTWTAANMTSVNGELVLPMEVDGIAQEYYIYWRRSEAGDLMPKNNEIKCGPCSAGKTLAALDEYMYYDGVALADMNNLYNAQVSKKGHGLSVSAIVGCEHESVMCREFEKKENISKMMAHAMRYKVGELWIEYLFKSNFVNRSNMANREYLWGKRNHFRKEFDDRITTIANQMTLGDTNCYSCKEDRAIRGTIFS